MMTSQWTSNLGFVRDNRRDTKKHVKLIRTDTTLHLSQKAKKGIKKKVKF